MAVKNYTGWPLNVNRIILADTTFSIGDSATKTDELESGLKRTIQKSSFCPDKFSVVMEFNWLRKDENGKTELQRFYEWYKYVHKYGSIPFEFPQIIYSPQSGIKVKDDSLNITRCEYYKITSTVEGAKRGEDIQMRMSWENVYGGTVNVPVIENVVNNISANFSYVEVTFNVKAEGIAPVTDDFSVSLLDDENEVPLEITGSYFDNCNKMRLYYDSSEIDKSTGHILKVYYNSKSYLVTLEA